MTKLVKVPKEKLRAKRTALAEHTKVEVTQQYDLRAPAPLAVISKIPETAVETYLAGLAEGPSRTTTLAALKKVAGILAPVMNASGRHVVTTDVLAFPWHKLTKSLTTGLRSHLQDMCKAGTSAPESVNHYLNGLRGVLRACADLGLMTYEEKERAISGAKRIKGDRELAGRALEPEEIEKLFAQCGRSAIGKRDAAMLVLLYACGLRATEAATARFVKLKPSGEFSFVGKGNKERTQWLAGRPLEIMQDWIKVRGDGPGPILLACDRREERGITSKGVYFRILALVKRAGIEKATPHDLRRSFFTHILDDERVDLFAVADLGGHSDLKTTRRYNRLKDEKKKGTMEKFHARVFGEKKK